MTDRRVQQREVFVLLLAITALVLPISGAVLFGGVEAPGSESAFAFLGAVSIQDFVPILLLVGAFGLLVASSPAGGRSTLARAAALAIVVAGAVLAVAHLGAAYHLRAGGAFDAGAGDGAGWVRVRVVTVASMVVTGVLCGAVSVQAAMWLGERTKEVVR